MKWRDDRLRYFIDTEFYEDGSTIDLISIGVVCSDGREFYRCSAQAQLHRVSQWVRENVLPHLPPMASTVWTSRNTIASELLAFVHKDPKPEFWGYYADYDWVVLCQLYGTMIQLPKHFPMFCMDLKQLSVEVGSPEHPKQAGAEHNALEDARWNRDLFTFLRAIADEEARAGEEHS